MERNTEAGRAAIAAHKKHRGDCNAVAGEMGVSGGKARRMYARAVLPEADRLLSKGLDDRAMGLEIRRLVDAEGLAYLPDVWARTGLTPARAKALYASAAAKPRPRRKAAAKK